MVARAQEAPYNRAMRQMLVRKISGSDMMGYGFRIGGGGDDLEAEEKGEPAGGDPPLGLP
jgi:hypothetical protein